MNKNLVGSFYLLFAACLYGLVGVFSRLISSFGSFSQSWVKSSVTLCIIGAIIFFHKTLWRKIRKEDLKWFVVWILPASLQPVLTFLAFNHLQIGVTYFLTYSTMILGGILSGKIFFAEKLNLSKFISLILLFIGLSLLYASNTAFVGNIYVLFALLAGLLVGFWNTLTKKVSKNYSEFQMMFLDNGTSLVFCFIGYLILGEVLPPLAGLNSWLWIFVFGAFLTLAGFFLIKGFKNVEAQVGSLILPTEIVFGSLFGYIFFGEVLKTNMYLGGLFILLAAILPSIRFSRND